MIGSRPGPLSSCCSATLHYRMLGGMVVYGMVRGKKVYGSICSKCRMSCEPSRGRKVPSELEEATGFWVRLGVARGALYDALQQLPKQKKYAELRKTIEDAIKQTACNPPARLDLDKYDTGVIRKKKSAVRNKSS